MENEVEWLRRDRDRWIEAWRKSVRDAEDARRCHEVEKTALLECIRKQDARLADLEARRTMLREQMAGERAARLQLHEDIDCVLAGVEGGGAWDAARNSAWHAARAAAWDAAEAARDAECAWQCGELERMLKENTNA